MRSTAAGSTPSFPEPPIRTTSASVRTCDFAEEMEDQIIANCERDLKGEIGFRRYNGDSYWAPDYDIKLSPQDRTRDFSEDMETRDALLPHAAQEAQWGIIDAIVSAHFGLRYARRRSAHARERRSAQLHRAPR